MPARLFCKTGDLAGSTLTIEHETTIGRLEENQIILHPTYISGHHARIYFDEDEGRYFLEDLGSSNGTRLDGTRITEPARLDRLHVITFAKRADFIFHVVPEASARRADRPAARPAEARPAADSSDRREKTNVGDFFTPLPDLQGPGDRDDDQTQQLDPFLAAPPPADPPASSESQASGEKTAFGDAFILTPTPPLTPPTDEPPPAEVTRTEAIVPPSAEEPPPASKDDDTLLRETPFAPTGSFMLAVTMPDETVQTFSLNEGAQVIGREPYCDITVPDTSISRRHARITVQGGTVTLEDLGSKNGTFVDGQKLTAAVAVHPRSHLRLGLTIEARLQHDT